MSAPATVSGAPVSLPRLAPPTRAQNAVWAACLIAACGLWLLLVIACVRDIGWRWWWPLAIVAGMAAADFASGVVHWAADTWGRSDLPFVGPRVLVPFRVHHVHPEDFLRRSFLDTNGDVAALSAVVTVGLLSLPRDGALQVVAVAGCAFTGVGMWTNQLHQWAHVPHAPWPARVLQRLGLALSREAHARHHAHPYDGDYCITMGWWNRPLHAVDAFPRLERLVSALTGAVPRQDDHVWSATVGRDTVGRR